MINIFSLRHLVLAALGLLITLSSAAGYCSQGSEWIEYSGSCYHWTRSGPINWFRAELNCRQFGGHLVSIGSQSDLNFLLRLTECSRPFWIGMVNTAHSLKGQARGYEWWDRTPHNFTKMNPRTNDYFDCVYSEASGLWYNYYCQYETSTWGYVCKSPAIARSGDDQDIIDELEEDHFALNGTSTTLVWPRTTPSPLKCDVGWQQLDNKCYFVSTNKTNYFNAQMSCQALGASVASVLTPREHSLLAVSLGCHSPVWIGLEKARPCFKQPNKDHCWVWMDRSPVNYFEWAPGQTLDRRDAECVIMEGQWKVMNCYSEYRYVCKKIAFELKGNKN